MSEDLYLCQKEIRRLRGVVRIYEAQMRELESYLEQMMENQDVGEEVRSTARKIAGFWREIQED